MSFDAVFLQLSTDQQEGEQRAASQQQSTLITVRAISKNPDEGYKGPRVYRGVFITRSSPYLFFFPRLVKKRNKGGTLLIEN